MTVEFWSRALGRRVVAARAEVIKEGFWPTTVSRVWLAYADGAGPRTVIVKCARPDWPGDPHGTEREARVYSELLAEMPVAQARRWFVEASGPRGHAHVVLGDLDRSHVFYSERHRWSRAELEAMLRTYARLHVAGRARVSARPEYLMAPLRERWTAEGAREITAELAARSPEMGLVGILPLVERMLDEAQNMEELAAGEPATLVHYDAYPPNVAFRRGSAYANGDESEADAAQDGAILIDWALATRDMGEVDLALLLQQPYGSDRALHWRDMLSYYYQERARLTGELFDLAERTRALRYARIGAWFTTLVPIHRAWARAMREGKPFGPEAEEPYAQYYQAMLEELIATANELYGDDAEVGASGRRRVGAV